MYLKNKTAKIFLLLATLSLPQMMAAQFNLQVGYGLSYHLNETYNRALEDFGKQNSWVNTNFKPLTFSHGLYIGLRNRWDWYGLGVSWRAQFLRNDAQGVMGNESYKKEYFHRFHDISVFHEFGNPWMDFGLSLDYTITSVSERHTGLSSKQTLGNSTGIGSHIYFNFYLAAGSFLDIALQPYLAWRWTSTNLNEVAKDLNSGDPLDKLKFHHLGLSLIFCNGNKRSQDID